MKNLKKKFIQEWAVKKMKLIISLFVFMFAGLIPVHLKAHDTSQPKPAWWTGKHLKLTYSANDNVCREMLEYFDKKYKPTSEMFRPNHEIDLDKMEWYDDHPWMIQKWQRVKNIKDYSSFINLAEMDTNGDGYKEIILRNIGMGRIYDTSPFQNIQIFTLEGGLDEFLAAQWKKVDGGRIINADTGMELINRKINERDDSFVELKFHPNYDPNKTEISANPSYSQTFLGGIQHPFSYQGEGYIAYIQPRTDFDQGKIDIAHWGLIQKVTKFWDKHDICYIAQLRQIERGGDMSYSNYFLNDQLKDTASFEYGSLAENINSGSLFRGETGLTDSNGVKKPDTITFGFGVDLRQNSIADIKQSFSDAGRSLSPGEVKVIEDFKAGKINLDDAKKSLNRDIKTTETGQHTFFSTICIAASVIFYLNQ